MRVPRYRTVLFASCALGVIATPAFAQDGNDDVIIVTAMSTLVGLELWVDQIGPPTKEQAPPLFIAQ